MSLPYGLVTTTSIYKRESARLASFINWRRPYPRQNELAAAGFYYCGPGDMVQCPFCLGMVSNWEEGDIPMNEHRRYFRSCPFVNGENCGNVPIGDPPVAPQ